MRSQPVNLRGCVPVDDVAFLVLKSPWDYDEDVTLANPDPFLDLSFDSSKSCDPIRTSDFDMV